MKYSFLLYISLVTLTSCRELVEDNFPDFTPSPTINSILATDSIVKVHLSLAEALSADQLKIIDNANISLYLNGEFVENMGYISEGEYVSSTIIEPDNTYSCEVSIPGFSTIYCRNHIPPPELVTDITHINKAGVDEEGMTYPAIQFTFTNKLSEILYFEAVIRTIQYGHERIAGLQGITDPVLINEGIPIALFSNELISDETYTMTINYTAGSGGLEGTNLYPLIFEFRSVSHAYYQFKKQLYFYELGRYPDEIGSTMATASLYSNIEQAYGIFAGYSSVQSDTIYPNTDGQ